MRPASRSAVGDPIDYMNDLGILRKTPEQQEHMISPGESLGDRLREAYRRMEEGSDADP